MRRILGVADLRPHKVRYWLHSPDPDFRSKVARICKLYLSPPAGAAVVCVDEKTCIQALERKNPARPAAPGREGRQEFEYRRHGTRALIAAFDVRTGEVFGQLRERRTAEDLRQFMEALARRYPRGPVYGKQCTDGHLTSRQARRTVTSLNRTGGPSHEQIAGVGWEARWRR